MNHKERMAKGLVYRSADDALVKLQLECLELYDYNHTRPTQQDKRQELLKSMFADIGTDCYIEPPLHANWAWQNVHFGNSVYSNFGLVLVDDTDIYVGDCTKFGPNVIVATAGHPILPRLRVQAYQFNKEVRIGANAWVGAGSIILPGVTIGDNAVIGAGSVVTKDIPANVVAVGNPCKVMRPISDKDETYFYKDEKFDWENIDG